MSKCEVEQPKLLIKNNLLAEKFVSTWSNNETLFKGRIDDEHEISMEQE